LNLNRFVDLLIKTKLPIAGWPVIIVSLTCIYGWHGGSTSISSVFARSHIGQMAATQRTSLCSRTGWESFSTRPASLGTAERCALALNIRAT
jgi:hypothetical protein